MKQSDIKLFIDGLRQELVLYQDSGGSLTFLISSAKKGFGELLDSFKTPRGLHRICAKIGDGMPINTVFVARQATGEYYSEALAKCYPNRDWILTRILWLEGLESGKNLGGNVDTKKRFIYIHGTPASEPLGVPSSHGCIRMNNYDIITVFNQVSVGDKVFIKA